MRLLNTYTGTFEEFHDSEIPRYAILSHTWPQKGEVAFVTAAAGAAHIAILS